MTASPAAPAVGVADEAGSPMPSLGGGAMLRETGKGVSWPLPFFSLCVSVLFFFLAEVGNSTLASLSYFSPLFNFPPFEKWRSEKTPPGGEKGPLLLRQSLRRDGRLWTPPLEMFRGAASPARAPMRPGKEEEKEVPWIRRRMPALLRRSSSLLLLRNSRSPLRSLRPSSARLFRLHCLLLPRRARNGAGVAAEAAAATGAR